MTDPLVTKLQTWLTEFVALLPNLAVALIVILVTFLVAGLVRRGVRTLMESVSNYAHANNLVATVARIGVILTGFFIALSILKLTGVVATFLAGAGVVGLALGFAFQDIAANFISGFMLAIRRPFHEGDIVETNDYLGKVDEINLRTTIIDTFQGQRVIIPNKEVLGNPMVNYSQRGRRRIDLSCGVAYGDDLEKAKRVALETVRSIEYRDESKDVDLYYNEFGGSSVNFVIRFWVEFTAQTDYLHAQSDAVMRLKKAYDDTDVTIPFPIRTLDFGVVGGEKLNEVLPRSMYRENGGSSGPGASASPASSSEMASSETASSETASSEAASDASPQT
ncbi:MAG: mechanosensitive ion channel protein MscS [Bacteroidetes bacterium QS_8_68_15]|nr:MAG: mechanosensitive ion channel protein MscS [Bacteroidetes bacterium QS_8_68_15]